MPRWVCPDCSSTKLAPQKPRRDDVRRYCLPCSEKTGRLVQRVCPVLQKKALNLQERRAKQRENLQKARRAVKEMATRRRKERVDWEKPLRQLHERWQRLRSWGLVLNCSLNIKRSSRRPDHGWAYPERYGKGKVVIYLDPVAPVDGAANQALLLHEMAHIAAGPGEHHSIKWRELFIAACDEILGEHIAVPDLPPGRPTKAAIHKLVHDAFIQAYGVKNEQI